MRASLNTAVIILLIAFTHTTADARHHKRHIASNRREIGVGDITGKIMGNLEAVQDAKVELMQKDKLVDKMQTDASGCYTFKYLTPGDYDVRVTKGGYRTSIVITIPVEPDKTTQNDLYLPKFNNRHMIQTPLVEDYVDNYNRYGRHK